MEAYCLSVKSRTIFKMVGLFFCFSLIITSGICAMEQGHHSRPDTRPTGNKHDPARKAQKRHSDPAVSTSMHSFVIVPARRASEPIPVCHQAVTALALLAFKNQSDNSIIMATGYPKIAINTENYRELLLFYDSGDTGTVFADIVSGFFTDIAVVRGGREVQFSAVMSSGPVRFAITTQNLLDSSSNPAAWTSSPEHFVNKLELYNIEMVKEKRSS